MRSDIPGDGACVLNLGNNDTTRRYGGIDRQWRPHSPLDHISRDIRWITILAVFAVASVLTGCCNYVQLPGMVKADAAWLGQPEIQQIRQQIYLPTKMVGPYDIVELRFNADNGTPTPINVVVDAPGEKQCDGNVQSTWTDRSTIDGNVTRARVPVALLAGIPGLTVTPNALAAGSIKLCTDDGRSSIFKPDTGVADWPTLQKRLENPDPAQTSWHGKLHAELIRRFPERALPGDELQISVDWRFVVNSNTGNKPHNTFQYVSVVDPDGYAFFPLLSSPSSDHDDRPLDRKWTAATNNALSQVHVWFRGLKFVEQPVLEDVGACFSLEALPPGYSSDLCNSVGIDPYVLAPPDPTSSKAIEKLRYRIEALQYWSLVLEDGRSFKEKYVAGQKIEQAVGTAYLKYVGRTLYDHSAFESLYLAVLPQRTLNSEASIPFWGSLAPGEKDLMSEVFLLPGDTVFVTHTRPRGQ